MRLWAEATPGGNAATTLIAFREVVPSPVALDRRDHSFGKLAVGATSPSVEVVVTNASGKPWRSMGATMIQSAPDFLLDWNDCTEAGPPAGGSCTLGVRFSPQSPGPKEVRLNVAAAADCRLVLDSAALTGLAEP